MTIKFKYSLKNILQILVIMLDSAFYVLSNHRLGGPIILGISLLIFGIHSFAIKRKAAIRFSILDLFMFLFSAYCLLTSFWAWDRSLAVSKGYTMMALFIMVALIVPCLTEMFTTEELLNYRKWGGYITVICATLYYGIDVVVSLAFHGERIPNSYINSNILGMLAATTVVIALYEIMHRGVKISDAICFLCVLMIAVSESRKAIFALVFGCVAIYILATREEGFLKKIMLVLLGVMAVIVFLYLMRSTGMFAGVTQRMQYLFNMIFGTGKVDRSARERQLMIQLGLEQFKKTPFFGIGIDNPRLLTISYFQEVFYLHNNYVEILAGGGIVGLALYYIIYAYVIIGIIKYRDKNARVIGLVAVLIASRLIMDYGAVAYYSKETYMDMIIYYVLYEQLKKGYFARQTALRSREDECS